MKFRLRRIFLEHIRLSDHSDEHWHRSSINLLVGKSIDEHEHSIYLYKLLVYTLTVKYSALSTQCSMLGDRMRRRLNLSSEIKRWPWDDFALLLTGTCHTNCYPKYYILRRTCQWVSTKLLLSNVQCSMNSDSLKWFLSWLIFIIPHNSYGKLLVLVSHRFLK